MLEEKICQHNQLSFLNFEQDLLFRKWTKVRLELSDQILWNGARSEAESFFPRKNRVTASRGWCQPHLGTGNMEESLRPQVAKIRCQRQELESINSYSFLLSSIYSLYIHHARYFAKCFRHAILYVLVTVQKKMLSCLFYS